MVISVEDDDGPTGTTALVLHTAVVLSAQKVQSLLKIAIPQEFFLGRHFCFIAISKRDQMGSKFYSQLKEQ